MMLSSKCPKCGVAVTFLEEQVGHQHTCKGCGEPFELQKKKSQLPQRAVIGLVVVLFIVVAILAIPFVSDTIRPAAAPTENSATVTSGTSGKPTGPAKKDTRRGK